MRTRTKPNLPVFVVLLVLTLFLAGPVVADTLNMKGGGKIEGEILSETPDKVKIRTRFGTMEVERDRIESIVRGKSIRQEFDERRDALAKDDAQGHYELALWAHEKGLRKDAKKLHEAAIAIDPMHKEANEALGRVLFDGRYMTPEEKADLLADTEAREMRAKGLVRYKDRWVTPEEKSALERGLVKHGGKWMSPDEKKKAQGFVKYKGRWVRADDLDRLKDLDRFKGIMKIEITATDSEHFRVFSVYPEAETRKVVDALERTYGDFARDFAVAPQIKLFYKAKCRVFMIQKALEFERLLRWYGKEMDQDAQRLNLILQNRGTYYVYPEPYILGYQFPDPYEQLVGRTVHKAAHILLLAWMYNGKFLPWWLTQGLGAMYEINVLGRCDTFFITVRGYADEGGATAEKWQNSDDWKAKLKIAVSRRMDPDLRSISLKDLNSLDHVDLAKSWSVMSWLMEYKRERLIEFVKLMKTGLEQEEAAKRAFGKDWHNLDKEWRAYVLNNY